MGCCRRSVGASLLLAAAAASAASAPAVAESGRQAMPGFICAASQGIDVRCWGAKGDDRHDDSAAMAAAVAAALAGNAPLLLPAGTYRLGHPLVIDYAAQASTGFRLVSMGAILDGRGIARGPVLTIACSGGTPAAPRGCFYFEEQGTLFVRADTDGYAVVIGRPDFADAQNAIKIDHLIVNNANTGVHSGGLQLNYVLGSEIFAVADAAGGGAGIALEQTQISRLSGAGSANGSGGAALKIENGYSFANTILAIDLEAAPTCLVIASRRAAHNTFLSPYLACPIAVDATAGNTTELVNPLFGGNVRRQFAAAIGIGTMP